MDRIVANEGRAVQIDLWIERITRIEIKETLGDLQPAEGQSRLHVFHAHDALEGGPQAGASQVQVHDGSRIRQISSNKKCVLGFDGDVEFPIADWRFGDRKIRTIGRWLR